MLISSVYASSNNNEDDESNQDDSTVNAKDNFSDEQNQQEETENDETSDEVTLEQEKQCASVMIQEPSYVDENGCHLSCPIVDSQTETMPGGCPQPMQQPLEQQQSSETPDNPNDPVTSENNPDTNVGFLDSGAIAKDTLKGKDIRSDSIETATVFINTIGYEIAKYFGITKEDVGKTFGKTVTICVETVAPGGNTVLAVPNCMTGLDTTQQFAVAPGQLQLDIQNSPQLIVSLESKYCSRDSLPKDSIICHIVFEPNGIQGDLTPKPNSYFGKSMIGP